MKTEGFNNGWIPVALVLAAVIVAGSIFVFTRNGSDRGVEILREPDAVLSGEVYIGGEVYIPGYYPLYAGDDIQTLLGTAGGTTDNADLKRLELYVSGIASGEAPQKIDINRAESWLLEALPGVGPTRARAIIDYRERNGPFRSINELVRVEGFGAAILESIRHLITVGE